MTVQQYLDEVKLRLLRYQVATDFDDLLIVSALNRAREIVVFQTLDIYPNLFITNMNYDIRGNGRLEPDLSGITNYHNTLIDVYEFSLPADFIKALEVWVLWETSEGITEWRQVRLVSAKEFYFTLKHAFNTSQVSTFVGMTQESIVDGRAYFYLGIPKAIVDDNNIDKISLKIFYHFLPAPLELYNDTQVGIKVLPSVFDAENIIPSFLEELVIQQTLLILLTGIDQANAYQRCVDELQAYIKIIDFNKRIEHLRRRSLLPSKKTIQQTNLPLISINIADSNSAK